MKYEIGTNDITRLGAIDFTLLSAKQILHDLSDCVCSDEILLFHLLLQQPQTKKIEKDNLTESFLLACTGGKFAHVLAFLDYGVDPNLKSGTGETPISSAAAWGNDAIVELLFNSGAKFQSTSVEHNEELSLVLQNCAPMTIMEVLSDTEFLQNAAQRTKIARLAADQGREDLCKLVGNVSTT